MTQPSSRPPEFISEAQYLEQSRESDVRLEYADGVIYAMAGEKKKNNRIAGNLYIRMLGLADERGCRVYMEGVQLRMPRSSKYYLPDVMLSCAPEGEDEYIEENPCVLVEVMSPSTAFRDCNEKKIEYFEIASLMQYILVSSDEQRVQVYTRQGSGWLNELFDTEGSFTVSCLDLPLTLEQIYAGVRL